MSEETGAKVKEQKEKCPICEKTRTEHCLKPVEIKLCPYEDKFCKNKEDDGTRISCSGHTKGSEGDSGKLGKTILNHMGKKLDREIDTYNGFDRMTKRRRRGYIKNNFGKYLQKLGEEETYKDALDSLQSRIKNLKSDKLLKDKIHPLGKGGNIQPHHLITNNSMNTPEWENLCPIIGYNVNCRWNGVYLPSDMKLACTAKVPLHKSNHKRGFAGYDIVDPIRYEDRVKTKLARYYQQIQDHDPCDPENKVKISAKQITSKLDSFSEDLFHKINCFEWTITWDGFNYHPNSNIGCAKCTKMEDKFKKLTKIILDKDKKATTDSVTLLEKKDRDLLEDNSTGNSCNRIHENIDNKRNSIGKYILKRGE